MLIARDPSLFELISKSGPGPSTVEVRVGVGALNATAWRAHPLQLGIPPKASEGLMPFRGVGPFGFLNPASRS